MRVSIARWMIWISLALALASAVASGWTTSFADDSRDVDFERDIRPLLKAKCVACHGPDLQEGGLRLDAREFAFRGGDNGPVIVAKQSADSELLRRVASDDRNIFMPPKGDRLSAAEIARLRLWIDRGAEWQETDVDRRAAVDPRRAHWAWQPLVKPAVPARPDNPPATPSAPNSLNSPGPNEIDAFLWQKLNAEKLGFAAAADRRTLYRRLSFDLLGLPPDSVAVERFATDPHPQAYEQLVDSLLQSPRYGERWARHWLDVVHYGDTHGYDKDKPRPHAWPYRDYVIRALNEDKPYARFIEEQVAGDTLFPGTRDGIEAMGFIAAGPWDFIGHAEVPETKIDGKIARHLDRDDMVANTLGTFCSVTIHCAQCHNHKFDPFTQEEYYSLQAVFAALDRADRSYFADAETGRRHAELSEQRRTFEQRIGAIDKVAREKAGPSLIELEKRLESAAKMSRGNTAVEFGYHSGIASMAGELKWVQVDLGSSVTLDRVVLRPCYDDFNNIGAGFGFPVRFRVELSDSPEFPDQPTTRRLLDQTGSDLPNPGTTPRTITAKGAQGRYLRVTATKLAPRQSDFIFSLAELQAYDSQGVNVARGRPVSSLDSIEAAPRWRRSNLVDDLYPAADESASLPMLRVERDQLFRRSLTDDEYREWGELKKELEAVSSKLKKLPAPSVIYAGTIHQGSGAFVGTGGSGGKPRPIHVLHRGNVLQPGREAVPGALAVLTSLPARFDLPPDHTEGQRRAALAKWLSSVDNPLTWRSIVNRVWQYHFGRGIVETSNDLGRMGAVPSHPELLDWLACDFRDHGGSLKSLHRKIVMSMAYRQSSNAADSPQGERGQAIDAENRLLWRQNRRKLEAEAVRDSVLAVSGKLDLTMGGPGFQDFVVEHPEHSPHYQYHLADPKDARTWRRSIYRFIVRSQTQPFMTSLDCADPSMRVERRNESVSAIQALTLLNNGFMVAQASHFADRVRREAGIEDARQIEHAFRLATARAPTPDELNLLVEFHKQQGLENVCRALLNLNEFTFVD
jgi:mono/diheme cytochrome c family protein